MKKLLIIILFLSLNFTLFAQTDTENIWNHVITLGNALVAKDSVVLDKMLMPDFVGVVPTGMSFPKQEYIRYHCRPNVGLLSIKTDDVKKASIRIYGDAAVVNHRVAVQRKGTDGVVLDLLVQRIDVFVKEKGNWMLASGQGTQVTQK